MMADPKRWTILLLVSSMLFLIVIDVTVLYTALPTLTHDLGATPSQKLWIINAYPLVMAGLLPAAGMLSDKLGHKLMFLIGLPLFALASICAAFSPTSFSLILSRGFLAIGAAISMPTTLAIVRQIFLAPKERALAIGIWSAVASGGAAIGPLIGGMLLHHFWWGAVFLINVPVVMLIFPLALYLIPKCGEKSQHAIDYWGALWVLIGLMGSIYALKELGKPTIDGAALLISGAVGIMFLIMFIYRQLKSETPMIDFNLFKNPRFSAGIMMAMLSVAIIVGVELLLSQRLQLVLRYSPLAAALYIIPIPIASVIAAPLAGQYLHKVGARLMMVFGLICTLIGVIGLAWVFQSSTDIMLLACLFCIGFGVGAIFTAASTAIMLNAPEQQAGMAASIEEVAYELGHVLGITLMGGVMTAIYTSALTLPKPFPVADNAYNSLDEALIVAKELPKEAANILINQANIAFDHAFSAVMVTTVIVLIICLVSLPFFFRQKPAI
ncbi:TPA: MFS transporter [Providencia alcalifaciens]